MQGIFTADLRRKAQVGRQDLFSRVWTRKYTNWLLGACGYVSSELLCIPVANSPDARYVLQLCGLILTSKVLVKTSVNSCMLAIVRIQTQMLLLCDTLAAAHGTIP